MFARGNDRREAQGTKLRGFTILGWGLYQQVVAVLGAFGMAALVGHWWDIGWRAFLATLVALWGETIRPATAFVLRIVFTVPLGWLGIDFELPELARDYLSVGAIMALSFLRLFREKQYSAYMVYAEALLDAIPGLSAERWTRRRLWIWLGPLYSVMLWPIAIVVTGTRLVGRLIKLFALSLNTSTTSQETVFAAEQDDEDRRLELAYIRDLERRRAARRQSLGLAALPTQPTESHQPVGTAPVAPSENERPPSAPTAGASRSGVDDAEGTETDAIADTTRATDEALGATANASTVSTGQLLLAFLRLVSPIIYLSLLLAVNYTVL